MITVLPLKCYGDLYFSCGVIAAVYFLNAICEWYEDEHVYSLQIFKNMLSFSPLSTKSVFQQIVFLNFERQKLNTNTLFLFEFLFE